MPVFRPSPMCGSSHEPRVIYTSGTNHEIRDTSRRVVAPST